MEEMVRNVDGTWSSQIPAVYEKGDLIEAGSSDCVARYEQLEYVRTPSTSPYAALQLPVEYQGQNIYYELNVKFIALSDLRVMSLNGTNVLIGYNNNVLYLNINSSRKFTVSSFSTNTEYNFGLGKKNSNSIFEFKNLDTSNTYYSDGSTNWGTGYYKPLFGGIYGTSESDYNINGESLQIYGIKIYENDVLVANYIPVRRYSDNLITMYDLVTEQYCNVLGDGTLIGGDPV